MRNLCVGEVAVASAAAAAGSRLDQAARNSWRHHYEPPPSRPGLKLSAYWQLDLWRCGLKLIVCRQLGYHHDYCLCDSHWISLYLCFKTTSEKHLPSVALQEINAIERQSFKKPEAHSGLNLLVPGRQCRRC